MLKPIPNIYTWKMKKAYKIGHITDLGLKVNLNLIYSNFTELFEDKILSDNTTAKEALGFISCLSDTYFSLKSIHLLAHT